MENIIFFEERAKELGWTVDEYIQDLCEDDLIWKKRHLNYLKK